MEVVAPNSLQTALDSMQATDLTLAIAGDFVENITVRKPGVTIIPKAGAKASHRGRVYVSQTAHHFTWERIRHDGRSSSGMPSPTFAAPFFTWRDSEVTNGNTTIGFAAWEGGTPDDYLIEGNWIHHVGKMPPANHDHGVYIASGSRGTIRHNLIHDCSDRGIQVWSDGGQINGALVENNTVAYCGQGILLGGTNAAGGIVIRKNIVAFPVTNRAGYEEYWEGQIGTGNVVADNLLWDPADQRISDLTGATFTRPRIVDPMFTDPASRDFRLKAGSPAAGYGPARLQPTAAPVPPDRAATLAQARAHMLKTTITYATWRKRLASGYYVNPDATEWAKAEKLLDDLLT